MRRYAIPVGLMCAVVGACGRAASPPTPVAVVPCALAGIGTADLPWREVRASGFTFCVPVSWRPKGRGRPGLDAVVWTNSSSAALRWGRGQPPPLALGSGMVQGTIVSVVPAPGGIPQLPSPSYTVVPPPCSPAATQAEDIGGRTFAVTQVQCQGAYILTAVCLQPALYLRAAAEDQSDAAVELAIVQTVRIGDTVGHGTRPAPSSAPPSN